MIYYERRPPLEMQLLTLLNSRMELDSSRKNYLAALRKGYEGEVQFDDIASKFAGDCYILSNLLFKFNNKTFQIDSLLIRGEAIHTFEIKTVEGTYYFEGEKFFKQPKTEYSNPLIQLQRSESLLRQMLQYYGIHLPIIPALVFMHPAFSLRAAPVDAPILSVHQLPSYFESLTYPPLQSSHKFIAEKLVSLIEKESFENLNLASYDYEELHKGISCRKCYKLSKGIQGWYVECPHCGQRELMSSAVMRNVQELKALFPKMKVTTTRVHEWCGGVGSNRRIRRILARNLTKVGENKATIYI